MGLGSWGTDAVILPNDDEDDFGHWVPPATIHTEVGSGTIQIQRRDAAGTGWTTVEEISIDTTRVIELRNMPAVRINPTSDAQFMVLWSRHGG
ncbi:hypothetical protein [Tropicimonas marinistellae]|uniref:hypothetical protein n=1 Tax=Tropicimonas marinistellae TaxID=1739787 RepID=UPI00082D9A3D|nr:hypothetical protein [Tropicimonas marinistellae]